MESRGPSFGITLVAVYVAGTISSSVWDLLGGALVLGDGYTLRNLIGSVALLALSASSGGASLGSALLLRCLDYLVSVGVIVSSRKRPPDAGDEPEYKLPPGTSWSEESSFWVRRR